MIKHVEDEQIGRWTQRPLCLQYAAVALSTVSVRRAGGQEAPDRLIHWGLGSTPDGDSEILGAWVEQGRGAKICSDVLLDLQQRGVQRIRVLVGCAAAAEVPVPCAQAGELAVETVVLADHGRALRKSEALEALRPATRRAALAVDELAEDLSRRLRAAVTRRGVLEDDVQAMNVVATFLQHADHQLELPALRGARIPGPAGISASLVPSGDRA